MKQNTKKSPLFAILSILLATLLAAVIPTEAEGAIYSDTLRIHILANSDTDADQELKLKIRDRLLESYSSLLVGVEDIDLARSIIENERDNIKRDVDAWILEEGYSYSSSVKVSLEWYDRREYEGFTLPEGYYTSLQIELGEASGKNWWCVMFPPLCLDISTESRPESDAYSDAEKNLIRAGKYSVKLKLLELAEEAVAQISKRG